MILNGPKVVMDGLEFETHIMKSKRKHVRISSFTLGENILHFKKKTGALGIQKSKLYQDNNATTMLPPISR